MPNLHQEHCLQRYVTFLALILLGLYAPKAEAKATFGVLADPQRQAAAGAPQRYVYCDFEHGKMGVWRFLPKSFAAESLGVELAEPPKNNHSRGALYCFVRDALPSGSVSYLLRDNGIPPIRITPQTRVAWCWNVSENENTDGFWLCLNIRNTRTGEQDRVQYVSWTESSHRVLRVYFDPLQVWVYHDEPIYDYLWRSYDPSIVDSFVIEKVTLGASSAPKLEAWIDNIWIGEGEPPDSVNVIETIKTNRIISSRLKGFSYGFLNRDWIPDRVDVYRDRAEILINPDNRGKKGKATQSPEVQSRPKKSLQTIDFDPQRVLGFASLCDLNNDGLTDVLFHFDDVLGNRCFRNRMPRGSFTEEPLKSGPLFQDNEFSYGAAASDLDLDGDIDLLQFNPYPRRYLFGGIRLIRNEGKFSFFDWTNGSRIRSELAFGATFGDVDGDGDQDLFAGYRIYYDPDSVEVVPRLYINNEDGKFSADLKNPLIPLDILIEGGVFADFDNDGDLDLYIVTSEAYYNRRPPANRLLLNDGTGKFTDVTEASGAACPVHSQAALAEDFDNDGLVDLYVIDDITKSIFFRNTGGMRFEAEEAELICSQPGSGGAAVDYDADGDMDIVIIGKDRAEPMRIENTNSDGKNFVEVRLHGISSNTFGIGVKVYLYEAGYVDQMDHLLGFREVNCSKGFAQFSPPVAHFGLGERRAADLKVIFPPVRGKAPVVVKKANVNAGSFLEIPEYQSPTTAGLYVVFDKARSALEGALFRIPVWFVSLLAFIIVCAGGISWRTRTSSARKSAFDAVVVALIVLAAALAIYRSLAWGVPVAFLGAVVTFFYFKIERVIRRLGPWGVSDQSLIEPLFEDLSQAIHTEKKFAALAEMKLTDAPRGKRTGQSHNVGFKNLDDLVSMMRAMTPEDAKWKQAREEIRTMRRLVAEVEGSATKGEDSERSGLSMLGIEQRHAVDRLRTILEDYRAMLRRRVSVSFLDEWRELVREYESTMAAQEVILQEIFPEGVESVGIHLRADEFRHIFKTCFDNSFRAMHGRSDKRIQVSVSLDSEGHLELRWADNGPGIPRSLLKPLFNEVVQSSSWEGRGEGCFTAGQKIRRRQGDVRAEETPRGKGALIFMRFVRVK
jgi:signal transduction histidine kinase